ncbi:MAG TPA: SDR family oxidoreductase, partial [Polyangiaceae bacterium]|nr:SDR family oxidoreductase [Polyangiaceae bacterium]
LALELAPQVRVNAVAPGTVLPPEHSSEQEVSTLAARIPLGHIGSANDVASAVAFLARSPFVTGHELVVDGGRTVAGFERF